MVAATMLDVVAVVAACVRRVGGSLGGGAGVRPLARVVSVGRRAPWPQVNAGVADRRAVAAPRAPTMPRALDRLFDMVDRKCAEAKSSGTHLQAAILASYLEIYQEPDCC